MCFPVIPPAWAPPPNRASPPLPVREAAAAGIYDLGPSLWRDVLKRDAREDNPAYGHDASPHRDGDEGDTPVHLGLPVDEGLQR
jgi:hypothetical protein